MTVYSPAINTYVPLATVTLAASSSSVTFSGIPTSDDNGNFRDLILVVNGSVDSNADLYIQVNGSASGYSTMWMEGTGSTYKSATSTNTTRYGIGYTTANSPRTAINQFADFSALDKHKTLLTRHDSTGFGTMTFAGRWDDTSAISSIMVACTAGTFNINSTFSLYALHG